MSQPKPGVLVMDDSTAGQEAAELAACTAVLLDPAGFNPNVELPCGLTSEHVKNAMQGFLDFLTFMNTQLNTRGIERMESMLMQANFSSVVGEFMSANIPKHCDSLVKNRYHNGHPDLVPKGRYDGDSVLHGPDGIEIKASRRLGSWQGHNAEDVWLMMFAYDANKQTDAFEGVPPRPFRFREVVGAQIKKEHWKFAGRSETSRRTITATVMNSGVELMRANYIYRDPNSEPKVKLSAITLPIEKSK